MDMVVVKSKIKKVAAGYNVSADFSEGLNERVVELVEKACERAEANGRKTVMQKDL